MMPIRIATICLAMMLIAGLNCRAEVSDEDSGNLVICILRMRSFPVRGINLQKFDEFKKSTKDKFMKFSADFFICRLLWCRDPEENILEHKDALLARVEQRLKADAFKSTYRLPLDEIEKAAGKTERISADERRQELEKITHSRELDADAKVNYLLWLLKDGMALTDFSNTKVTREDFDEGILLGFEIALRLGSGDGTGFTRLAEMIAACGEYDRLVWRVEGAGRRVAKEAKERNQP